MAEMLRVGATLSHKYRVERLLDERDGVQVYEARDATARLVGVKIIRRERLSDTLAFARFQLDAWDASVVDFGNFAGIPYFVTTDYAPPSIPIYVDLTSRRSKRSWPWIAMLLITGITGAAGGWYAASRTARAHATATMR